eukprot:CAMPEP_0182927172 /NCGR_PEP_ID=MMETSP0105_2-20130417/13390_1 /TAXON_ID=81532 ORGANISM="Acanthoeca-like sp., Strain 10tr" /NCGR_SAMPLE_ID=MMETSP0105_2 /ASSEMBLY_ACC=CAM_ASM_000205 /LENGTH=235 /DNA_ID=CAMNT_0025065103 /DNA_START=43 /DNA_END=750 /DNA_ORIENTATION=+
MADAKQAAAKDAMQTELVRNAQIEEVKREADNERYARAVREMMFDVADDLRRTVAKSEAIKAMSEEQAARAHAVYFKTYIAEFIDKTGAAAGADGADPMLEVREELLREIHSKEADAAIEDEKERRILEQFKHEISDGIRRSVAQQQARLAVEVEKAQRIQQDRMKVVGEELVRAVAAGKADKAAEVEQAQRVQADYFKRMVMGQIAKDQELAGSPSMQKVQAALLAEIQAKAAE